VRGTVTEFDERRGLGTVRADDGRAYLFHCTQVAGGTRTIAVGTPVTFTVWPRLGRYEAADVTPA
jgi:cold shock CspA family protein